MNHEEIESKLKPCATTEGGIKALAELMGQLSTLESQNAALRHQVERLKAEASKPLRPRPMNEAPTGRDKFVWVMLPMRRVSNSADGPHFLDKEGYSWSFPDGTLSRYWDGWLPIPDNAKDTDNAKDSDIDEKTAAL